ncbi:IS3 family transposase [Xanthomonas citri]|uniref:IS3 family transposase n=1 Tax=Xanthomonas citri TaxID=346 RepID=UPI0001CED749|nr:IS3 family transposase [Xanthomonas citri]EFF48852.1 ISPsy8, transposase OrfB [Xanthomonas citri pv. aurantifolii str. ICPB 10535]MCC8490248.1 IS3 family transposase [Xanthomonas citri pv. fuscans]
MSPNFLGLAGPGYREEVRISSHCCSVEASAGEGHQPQAGSAADAAHGLKSLIKPKRYKAYKGEIRGSAPILLERNFNADEPEQQWVIDVTESNVEDRKIYLSPVMGLYNRKIIAFPPGGSALLQEGAKHAGQGLGETTNAGPVGTFIAPRLAAPDASFPSATGPTSGHPEHVPQAIAWITPRWSTSLRASDPNCSATSTEQLREEITEYIHYYNHDHIMLKLKGLSPVQYRTQP